MSIIVGDNIGLIKIVNPTEFKVINEFYNAENESEILFLNHYKNKVFIFIINNKLILEMAYNM